ncbi:MAG: M4 family metallopeptidase [Bacteroidota bacterium]
MQKSLRFWRVYLILLCGIGLMSLHAQNTSSLHKPKKQQPPANFDPGFPVKEIRRIESAKYLTPPTYQSIPFSPGTVQQAKSSNIIDIKRSGPQQLPIQIRSHYSSLKQLGALTPTEIETEAVNYLTSIKADLNISAPDQEFSMKEVREDVQGYTHVRLQQMYQGIPVYGAELMVHFSPSSEVRMGGRYQSTPALSDLTPDFVEDSAKALVLRAVKEHTVVHELEQQWKDVYNYSEPQTTLVLYRPNDGRIGPHRLTWHVMVRPNVLHRWEYFIDAETGEVVREFSSHCTITGDTGTGTDLNGTLQDLNISNFSGTYSLWDVSKDMYTDHNNNNQPDDGEGFILTLDMNNDQPGQNANVTYITSQNKNSWDAAGVSAHVNAGKCYDYFRSKHGRSSINGQGGDIISIINVANPNTPTAQPMDNAFWSGGLMFYGAGNTDFTHLAGALDVAAHEMTHGVVEATANLEYQGQSGALNESFADIFGVMVDLGDWQLGEDVVKQNAFPGGIALRDMSDPHQGGNNLNSPGWQPSHMNEYWPDPNDQDHGGVHVNSGIVNHAFYLFATANGMNETKAEKVYYEALQNLTRSSQFIDCRLEVIAAAKQIYGQNEADAAANAFFQVGIGDAATGGGGGSGGGSEYQVDVPQNPGTSFFATNNVDDLVSTTLQITSNFNNPATPLSTRIPISKMSISDDGSMGYFVGDDNHIYEIRMDTGNPQEHAISNEPDWGNVAISKNGRLLAAVTQYVDTSIFVFDLWANPIAGWKFTLYNPTTAQGTNNTGGVLYADALAWDHCGEFLMYDAFNKLPNASPGAPDIEFWDVNFMRVWDQSADQVGDGVVVKLFSNLPEDVSVGNAVFSKNSPYIIAYDQITPDSVTVFSANIETGDIGYIWSNASDVLGYPEWDRSDQFLTFNAKGLNGGDIIALAAMLPNKLQLDVNYSTYNPFVLLEDANWGVWYAEGTRDLSTACIRPNTSISPDLLAGPIEVFPNPFSDQLTVQAEFRQATDLRLRLFDLLGKEHWQSHQIRVHPGAFEQQIQIQDLPVGTYLLQVEANRQVEMRKIVKW